MVKLPIHSTKRGLITLQIVNNLLGMNSENTGKRLREIRTAKNMKQKDLAEKLGVEAKTISKWETGKGFPDISYIPKLSEILSINAKELLEGKLTENEKDPGNMKKMNIYYCRKCSNITLSTSSISAFCCSEKLEKLKLSKPDFRVKAEISDSDLFIGIEHEMTKENYIAAVILLKDDLMIMKRLYPEGSSEVRLPFKKRAILKIIDNHENLYSFRIRYSDGRIQLISEIA